MKRSVVAAGLLAAALAALLIAWFASGWPDVRARQRTERAAPILAAEARAGELARDLRGELSALLGREVDRPYFHYQNLYRDPRARGGVSVTPSPLATGDDDPLVLGYFQLDAAGRTTTPTINDEVPELSEGRHLAENQRFRDEVIKSLSVALGPAPPSEGRMASREARQDTGAQVVTIDPGTYFQNSNSASIAQQQAPSLPSAGAPVTITVSALEWRTLPFAGAPALVAVRHVTTPDGTLAQGFVVDRSSLTAWLAERAGDAVIELATGDAIATEIAPSWHLEAMANDRAIEAAEDRANGIASGFVTRFVIVGVIAMFAAALVVLLVARAERLARERSQFAAAAAHELRTPLAGLQLYGDMLADGLGDPAKQRDYARRMSEEAARLGRVVSNVLGFSQLERGNLSVEPRAGELGLVLHELADRARPALDRAGACLSLEVPAELPATFDADAVARIVGNLLDNAEKYGRDAEDRTIALSARDAGDRVEVAVTDRGPGIPAQTRGRLFRPFARGVGARGDGPAGLGLGLALSRSLARAMGGDLEYRGGAGAGATFVVTLPRT